MRESEAMAVLTAAQGIGYMKRAAALEEAGSALALLEDPGAYAAQLGAEGIAAIRKSLNQAERMLDKLRRDGVSLIVCGEADYPRLLEQTARPPHLLYCMGDAALRDPFPVAVVGTRRASGYGLRHTHAFSKELAEAGACIVSGLALGVDAQAHLGALEGRGRTVAVLGGALDKMYPRENIGLMRRILENGGSVISEYAPGTEPTRYSFLHRNRIIAGVSLGVLVTEGPGRSGALSTAQHALDAGREVFALPGDIDRVTAQLPNRLIAEGARPVLRAKDILDAIVIEAKRGESKPERKPAERKRKPLAKREKSPVQTREEKRMPQLGMKEQKIYQRLLGGDADFDALCEASGMGGDELGAALMMMELEGVVQALPGCRWRLA